MAEPSQEISQPFLSEESSSPPKRASRFAKNRVKPLSHSLELSEEGTLLCDAWRLPNKRRLQIGFVGITFLVPFLTLSLVNPGLTGHIGNRLSLGLFSFVGQAALTVPLAALYVVLSCAGFRPLKKTRYLFLLPMMVSTALLVERWSHQGGWFGGLMDRALVASLGPGGAWMMTLTFLVLCLAAFIPRLSKEIFQGTSLIAEHFHESRLRLRAWAQRPRPKSTESGSRAPDVDHAETSTAPRHTEEKPLFFLSEENETTPGLTPMAPPHSDSFELPGSDSDEFATTPEVTEVELVSPRATLPPAPPAPLIKSGVSSQTLLEPDLEVPNVIRFAAPDEIEESLELEKPSLTKSGEAEAAVPKARIFELPPLALLDDVPYASRQVPSEDKSQALLQALDAFGVKAKLLQIVRGPTVTRYELQPARGVKVSKFTSLTKDIALALASTAVRIEAPIPGKSAIGIEIPNKHTDLVVIKDILRDSVFTNSKGLTVALGKDLSGRPVVTDLQKMPHLLVAGTTGSGKSVCVNGLILSLLYRFTPDQLQLMMVDPKQVELSVYEDIPHLVGFADSPKGEIIVDPKKAASALNQVVNLMEERYKLFAENKVRNLAEYNQKFEDQPLPWFVVIIDELADLMMVASKSVETSICRIAQKARAAGIHLVLATQRPSADVITGLIKVNIPSRIAFAVSSQIDSRVILDTGGAEQLLGKGDMLFQPVDASDPKRLQGGYVNNDEIFRVVEFWKGQGLPENRIEFEAQYDILDDDGENDEGDDSDDSLLEEALRVTLNRKQASASMLQTELKVGYARARRLLIAMERKGWVGPAEGSKPRKIFFNGPLPGEPSA